MHQNSFYDRRIKPTRRMLSVGLQQPGALFSKREYILLISHMRGYTSVLSHIVGSHEEVSGYSELHIPYRRGLDFYYMRGKVFRDNQKQLPGRYVFDKVLHNRWEVRQPIMDRDDVHLLFMLRKPEDTLRSLLHMPTIFNLKPNLARSAAYYVNRMTQLRKMGEIAKGRAIYLDGEDLIQDSEGTLKRISEYIGLEKPLSEEYQTFQRTGRPGAGDPSDYIKQGKIVRDREAHEEFEIPERERQLLNRAYEKCREVLMEL